MSSVSFVVESLIVNGLYMTDRDKDRSLEHLLRQSRTGDPAPTGRGACLDAEALAAWADGGLTPRELAMAEAHVSECARCQTMTAALMKQPIPVRDEAERRVWQWGLGWLVPLAAGVAAVGLWFAAPQRTSPAESPRPGAPSQLDTRAAVPSSTAADRVAPAEREPTGGGAAPATPEAPAETRLKTAEQEPKAESLNALRRDEAVAAPPPAEPAQQGRAAALQDAVGGLAKSPAAAPRAALDAAAPAAAAPARTTAVMRQAVGAREIASPDPSIRWRLGVAGSVEVTLDGGASWQAQPAGVTAELTAGSAASTSVCWLVGRTGLVLRTTDGGRSWLRVDVPQTVDLIGVQASDAQTATVTASDGRVFRTADAGRTWQ